MTKILVLYYSANGGTQKLAESICEGVLEAGAEYILRRVEGAAGDCPIVTADDYQNADGWIIGSPTRFGNVCSKIQGFFDSLGGFWMNGGLNGKPAAAFTSTSTMHGGQEATLLAMHVSLLHLGAVIVGIPYYQTLLGATEAGGTPYGASHWAPTHTTELTDIEKALGRTLGARVAQISQKLKA